MHWDNEKYPTIDDLKRKIIIRVSFIIFFVKICL